MGSERQLDNQRVRVTRWTLQRGEQTGPHRHEYDYVVVPLLAGRMLITAPDGSESVAELSPGTPYYRAAGVEHNVSNPHDEVVDFVEVELLG